MCLEQYLEDQEYEFNARFDYTREAYAATAENLVDSDAPDGYVHDPVTALAIVTGGNATFTMVSVRTGARYTYRVRAAKDNPGMLFVSTLVGPDNENDYAYVGFIRTTPRAALHAGKKGTPDDVRFRALAWLLDALAVGHMPLTVEFWHEGRCARCNRLLTDPESIARGFGPECARKA